MDISFHSKILRDQCEDIGLAEIAYGRAVSTVLFDRLADIDAAVSVDDLIAGKPRSARLRKREIMKISLVDGYVMHLEANHAPVPLNKQGEIIWGEVRRLKLLKLERDDS